MENILVTGATGQIGSELTLALRQQYRARQVVAAGHRRAPERDLLESGPYCRLNVRDAAALQQVVHDYRIDTIYHLASVLSAAAEQAPQLAWQVNMVKTAGVAQMEVFHLPCDDPTRAYPYGAIHVLDNLVLENLSS